MPLLTRIYPRVSGAQSSTAISHRTTNYLNAFPQLPHPLRLALIIGG
jgi:hypothetical protein